MEYEYWIAVSQACDKHNTKTTLPLQILPKGKPIFSPCFFGSCILWGPSTDMSTDTSVDTRPSISRYSIEYRSIYRSSTDRCIDRYSYRSIYLAIHRYLTDTWPIFDRYLTDTWLILDRYLTDASPILYIGRHSTDTRPVSVDICIGWRQNATNAFY